MQLTIQRPAGLLCEYTANPIGIDIAKPRFSWVLGHFERGRTQSAYQILVSSTKENLLKDIGDVWDSGRVESSRSINVEYKGKALESRRIYCWKVRWWDDKGQASPLSESATLEIGLLRPLEQSKTRLKNTSFSSPHTRKCRRIYRKVKINVVMIV